MATRTNERTSFYSDIISTAVEGGTNYWAFSRNYKWSDEDPGTTRVEFCDMEYHGTGDEEWYPCNVETVAHAFTLIMGPKEDLGINDSLRARYSRAYRGLDAGEIDAGDADNIVQIGMFGKIVYG